MKKEIECSREILFEGRVFTAARLEVETESGKASREVVFHHGGSCVVAINDKNEIALVRQFRIAVKQFMLELPAGKLEAGEDPLDCARRELIEEAGWKASKLQEIALIYPTPGYSSEPIHIYMASDIKQTEQQLDEGEELEVMFMPFEEAYEKVMAGEITDGKSVAGILKAKALLERREKE